MPGFHAEQVAASILEPASRCSRARHAVTIEWRPRQRFVALRGGANPSSAIHDVVLRLDERDHLALPAGNPNRQRRPRDLERAPVASLMRMPGAKRHVPPP